MVVNKNLTECQKYIFRTDGIMFIFGNIYLNPCMHDVGSIYITAENISIRKNT